MSRTKRENHIGDHTMKNNNATGIKHSLSVDLCIDLGNDVVAALIFHHIQINVRSRLADNVLDENGTPWFECSYSGICNYMIELTPKQVECGIKRLKEAKLIKVITSNKKNKYTLTECGWDYYPLTEEEKKKINIPVAEEEEAKSVSAAQTRSDDAINKRVINVSDDVKEVIDYVSQKVGKHIDYAPSYIRNINSLFAAGYTKADMIAVVDYRYADLQGTKEFNVMMNPSKLFFIKTFQSFLDDAKGDSDITMTEEQLARDVKEKEKYHLKQAELCKCEKIILGTGSCDNLPFDLTTDANTEEMMHDRARKQRYHLSEAKKFRNMAKLIKAQSVK